MSKREIYQLYSSPYWAMFELLNWYKEFNLDRLQELLEQTWFEPCVGNFDLVKAAEFWCKENRFDPPKWVTNDFDPDHGADTCIDAKNKEFWRAKNPFVSITNPPFGTEGTPIVENAVRHSNVAWMYLRLTFLEYSGTRIWLSEFPPDKFIVLPRFSFARSKKYPEKWGVDNIPCAWFLWDESIKDNRPYFVHKDQIKYFYKNPEQGFQRYPQLFQ